MTSTVTQITGNLIGLDEQQRTAAIVAALRGPVAVLGDAAGISAALESQPDTTVTTLEDDEPFEGVIVARAARGSELEADVVERLHQHAAGGGAWVLDTSAEDPARWRLQEASSAAVTTLVECEVIGTFLASETADIPPSMRLATTLPIAAAAHANRVVLFCGVEPTSTEDGQAVLFPTPIDEISRLRRAVRDLELTNRRLAEGRLGVHDAAAGRAAAAATELAAARAEIVGLHERLESAVFHAKQNDELFQDARLQLFAANARVATLEAELYRHQIEPRKLAKRAFAKVRNRIRPR